LKTIRVFLGVAISALFLFLIFRAVDVAQVWSSLKTAEFAWIPLAVGIYFCAVWLRTTRWTMLMKPVKKCATRTLFPIYIISYMANNVLPLRIGDIYRAYIVGKKERVSKSASLVTIGVERIFDGLTMLLLLFLSFIFYPVSDKNVKLAIQAGALIFLTAIVVCYIIVLNRKWAFWFFHKILPLTPEKFHHRMDEIFGNFFKGLDALKGAKDILRVIGLSLATWLVEAASYLVVLWSFGFSGQYYVAVSAMALVNLMIIVPAAPGYFGPFEAACIIILGKTGYGNVTHFTDEIATAYALVLHVVVQWIPSTFLGLYYMWREHISFKEIQTDSSHVEQ